MAKEIMNLNLERETIDRVDAAIGRGSRSAYVRGAIVLRLAVERQLREDANDEALGAAVRALYRRSVEEAA